MSLRTNVSDYLASQHMTESDGPPVAYFHSPNGGIRHVYVKLHGNNLDSQNHAERVCLAELARMIPDARPQEPGRYTHVFWRTRPEVAGDEFGLWTFYVRFVMADPSEFTFGIPEIGIAHAA